MSCTACGRANLPGGIRCAYCGVELPVALDFHVQPPGPADPSAGQTGSATGKAGCAVSAVILALKGKSLLALLQFGKIATTLASMGAFVLVDSRFFGWRLGIGFAVVILIHELGHVFVNRLKGIPSSPPMFIPGLGALIFVKRFPDDPTAQAECGAGGPAAGGIAAFVCLGIAWYTHGPFWYALAFLGFIVNLANLMPIFPLDGSHMATVFSPAVWTVILVGMLAVGLKMPLPFLWLLIAVVLIGKLSHASDQRHNLASPIAKARMGAIYLALCLGLSWGITNTAAGREAIRTEQQALVATSSQPAETPSTEETSATPLRRQLSPEAAAVIHMVRLIAAIVLVSLPLVLWLIVAQVLRGLSGRPRGWRALRVAAFPLGLELTSLWLHSSHAVIGHATIYAGAALAAAVAGLASAIVQSSKRGRKPHAPMSVQASALGWAAGGALIVAYAADSWPVAFWVLVGAVLYYWRYPWVGYHWLTTVRASVGDAAGALKYLDRALASHPEAESLPGLHHLAAELNLRLSRGGPALSALDGSRDGAESADALMRRAACLALVHRFDEALTCCERILAGPPDEASPAARLLVVHLTLARLALARGWHDEALAQIDWCIAAAPSRASTLVAALRLLRAEALCGLRRSAEALEETRLVGKISRAPEIESAAATQRSAGHLAAGSASDAVRESARAVMLAPGALPALYWRGKALLAAGQVREGMELLRKLASDWPAEHWGMLAAAV